MKGKKKYVLFAAIGTIALASVALLGVYFLPNWIHSNALPDQGALNTVAEQIEDNEVPLAAPSSFDAYTAGETVQLSYLTQQKKRVKPDLQQTEEDQPAVENPTKVDPSPG